MGIIAIEMSPAKNICSSINTSKLVLKSVCHGGKQVKDKIVSTVRNFESGFHFLRYDQLPFCFPNSFTPPVMNLMFGKMLLEIEKNVCPTRSF